MTKQRSRKAVSFGVLAVLLVAIVIALAFALNQKGSGVPTDDQAPVVTEQPTPQPTQPSHLPPIGGDPGKVTHGPVTPSQED